MIIVSHKKKHLKKIQKISNVFTTKFIFFYQFSWRHNMSLVQKTIESSAPTLKIPKRIIKNYHQGQNGKDTNQIELGQPPQH